MKNNLVIKRLFFLLLIVFTFLYIYGKNGYYEVRLNQKKTLTENQMALFEEDIKNGIAVDINDYLPKDEDYSNYISRSAYKTTKFISGFISNNIKKIWDIIKTLFIS